jgi:hypothetical protein
MTQTQEFPVVTGDRMHPIARRNSIKALVKRANYIGIPIPDFMWDALNNRYLRKMRIWKARYNRQRQHALQLQALLTEKNSYIRELQDEIATLKTPDYFAK